MLRGKRSQAAMEFLMTYGWAILVVLIVIGALAYFGILDPQSLLPERCTFQTGFNCRNHIASASSDNITLEILNGIGRTIVIKAGSTANGTSTTDNPLDKCVSTSNVTINNGATGEVHLACTTQADSGDPTNKYRWNLAIKWKYADATDTYITTMAGDLFAAVQE